MSARFSFFLAALLGLPLGASAQTLEPIGTARQRGAGATVSVSGVVTRAKGAFVYFQDATGGLSLRQTSGSSLFNAVAAGTVRAGCQITATGRLSQFPATTPGVLQISGADLTSYSVGTCDQAVAPQLVTLADLVSGGEAYESELVRVTNLSFVSAPPATFAANSELAVTDGAGQLGLRVPQAGDSDVDGLATPALPFVFEGVVGQFTSSTSPTLGYQLMAIAAGDVQSNPSAPVTVSFASATGAANESAGAYDLAVRLDRASASDVTVTLTVTGGTATSGVDYTVPSPFTVTVPAGQTTAAARLGIAADGVDEGNETATFALAVASGPATAAPGTFTLTISDPLALGSGTICPGLVGEAAAACVRQAYPRTSVRPYGDRTTFYSSFYTDQDPLTAGVQYRCVYTGRTAPLGASGSNEINTEHTFPRSWMNNVTSQEGDMHNLYLTIALVNSDRGNDPFGEVPDASALWYGPAGDKLGAPVGDVNAYSEDSGPLFEPREDHKGNVARAMAYMHTLYGVNSAAAGDWETTKRILLTWNRLDAPDAEELSRNQAIVSYQGNLNPFISDTTLVRRVYFPDALPVELVAFMAVASGRTARLAWTTASETNNAGFVVQRQTATGWADASPLLAGAGTTTERHSYAFDVSDLTAGRHTFRLRQTDTDGTVHYSGTVSVEISAVGVANGPAAQGGVRLTALGTRAVRVETDRETLAELFDVLGRRVLTQRVGTGTTELSLSGLSTGRYLVRVGMATLPIVVR